MGNEFVIGIDLGGTNIVTGIFDCKGELIARYTRPTGVDKEPSAVLNNMVAGIEQALQDNSLEWDQIDGIAVGTPGFLNREAGMVYLAPNLNWENYPLKKELGEKTGCTVILENDANAAIYGEFRKGCAREFSSAVGFTLGTGVGGGIIIDGMIVHGCFDMAAELGHMTIDPDGPICGCGNRGCLEAFASATAVKRYLRDQYEPRKDSLIYSLVGHDMEKLSPAVAHQAALKGDALAIEVLARTGKYLGIATANVINIFNPPVVFFNGGMIHAGDYIMKPLIDEAKKRTISASYEKSAIRIGHLGSDAGLLGIGALAVESFIS